MSFFITETKMIKSKKFVAALVISLAMTFPVMASKTTTDLKDTVFTSDQMYVLRYAYDFGNQFDKTGKPIDYSTHNKSDQHKLGIIMAAIAWQESGAGINTGINKPGHKARGVFQNYLPTVKNVVAQEKLDYTEAELLAELDSLDGSAAWSIRNLQYWLKYHKGDLNKSVASYYGGTDYRKGTGYARDVFAKAKILESHLKKD